MGAVLAVAAGLAAGWACRAWWGRRRWEAPLRSLTRTAELLARGDHEARATVYPGSPLSGFAATMNLLAERFAHDVGGFAPRADAPGLRRQRLARAEDPARLDQGVYRDPARRRSPTRRSTPGSSSGSRSRPTGSSSSSSTC